MPAYAALTKPLAGTTEADLGELEGTCEAFWLEYKQEMSNSQIAKAVAAFANCHGGWVFIGVPANERNEPLFPTDTWGVPRDRHTSEGLRQTITANIQPVPDVLMQRVDLANGQCVWILCVDEGMDAPYIRVSDGRIYIRRGDVSEPIDVVKDRYELDRLYDKGQRHGDRVLDRLE